MSIQSGQGLSKSQSIPEPSSEPSLFSLDAQSSQPEGVQLLPSRSAIYIREGKESVVVTSTQQQPSETKKESKKSPMAVSSSFSKLQAAAKKHGRYNSNDAAADDEAYRPEDLMLSIEKFSALDRAKYGYDFGKSISVADKKFIKEKNKIRVNDDEEQRQPKQKKKRKRKMCSLEEIYQRCPRIG